MGLLCATQSTLTIAQDAPIFHKGEIATINNHTGTVWLNELSGPDSIFNYGIAVATFAPGAKLDWHVHPGGQILLVTEGIGYYQEKGKPRKIVRKGEVIKCLPGILHWHTTLAWCITKQQFCLYSNYTDAKRKNNLAKEGN